MALIIDINTDELENAVQIARRTNDALSEVANLLNGIVVHTDWQCAARDRINNNTRRNRQDSMQLQNDAEALYKNINYVSQEFLAAERTINSSFDTVDGLISGFLSHTPSLSAEPSGALGKLAEAAGGGVRKALNIVSFENIADAFKGK